MVTWQDLLDDLKHLKQKVDAASQLAEELAEKQSIEELIRTKDEIAKSISELPSFQESIMNRLLNEIEEINNRIDGISLTTESISASPTFGCGQEQKSDSNNLAVMYGTRDGTGCGVGNVNYYKSLKLLIPDKD